MALLATLEGEKDTISLNDLFDVNDFLGVKYFGPENWNRVKKCACVIASGAANNPVVFWLDNLKNDYPQPSQLANCLFGFNDEVGRRAMGAPAWNTLKSKMDAELLGKFSIGGTLKKVGSAVGSGVKTAYNVTKTVATAPLTIGEKVWTETPLKYTPGGMLYKKMEDVKDKVLSVAPPLQDLNKDPIQYVTDKSSKILYSAATKTPLKYTGYGILTKLTEKAREKSGITSPGTAEVNKTQEEINAEKRRAAEAAAKAASAASAKQSQQLAAAKKLKAEKEKTAEAEAAAVQAQQEAATTQQILETTQQTLTSKYAPWLLGGAGVLLALSILKK